MSATKKKTPAKSGAAMNSTTRTYPRTSGQAFKGADYGQAIWPHEPVRINWCDRLMRAASVVLFVAVAAMACSGPDDVQAEADTAAALQDALREQQRLRPDLWTPADQAMAEQAARIAAAHQQQPKEPQ